MNVTNTTEKLNLIVGTLSIMSDDVLLVKHPKGMMASLRIAYLEESCMCESLQTSCN